MVDEEKTLAKETTEMFVKQLKHTLSRVDQKRPHLYEELRELLRALDDGKVTPPDSEDVKEALRNLKDALKQKKPDPESLTKALEFFSCDGWYW